jgi:hypothetical protein
MLAPASRSRNEFTPLPAASRPWSIEESEACFVVRDHNGHQRAYVAERKTRRWRRRGVRSKNYDEARTSYRQWRLAIKPILWAGVTNDYARTPLPSASVDE